MPQIRTNVTVRSGEQFGGQDINKREKFVYAT